MDKRERRYGPDGTLMTRKEFQKKYGGTREWNAAKNTSTNAAVSAAATAVPAAALADDLGGGSSFAQSAKPATDTRTGTGTGVKKAYVDRRERRLGDDGKPYTRSEFQRFYGGTDEWDAAPVAPALH